MEARRPRGQRPGSDRVAQAGHQRQVIVQVVDRGELRAEDLVHPLQVMQVAAREIAACVAAARRVERRRVRAVAARNLSDVADGNDRWRGRIFWRRSSVTSSG